jgi:hypothetical protein
MNPSTSAGGDVVGICAVAAVVSITAMIMAANIVNIIFCMIPYVRSVGGI